ncbi:MAG: metallophosphoesterase [Candidatus Omnitrophota bacterium]
MTRIGVISDTHISNKQDELPAKIIAAFKAVDMIIHCGDILDLGVLDKLRQLCPDVRAVAGNMDSAETKEILPEKEIITVGKYKIGVAHGYGHPAGLAGAMEKIFKADAVDAIVFGHSHTPLNERRKGILFFNPGSPTDKVFAPFNSYGILEINDRIKGKIIKI